MKKNSMILVSIVFILLLAAFSTAIASPAGGLAGKPTHDKTPAARATENALEKETRKTGKDNKRINFSGLVEAVDSAAVTVKLVDESLMTCSMDADTRISIPGNKNATAADIAVGSKVHLQAKELEDGCLALKINAIPGKPERKHHVGTVSAYETGVSITIAAKDGTEATFLITGETKIVPEERTEELTVGSLVTIISPREITGGEWEAAGIVVHPENTGTDQEELAQEVEIEEVEPAEETVTP